MRFETIKRGLRATAVLALAVAWTPSWSQADAAVEAELRRLAGGDAEAAVEALVQRGEPEYYALMQALFKGQVYVLEGREELGGLVMVGREEEDDYGDISVTLLTPYPQQKPVLGSDGQPLVMLLDDLEEVESGRRVRALIQPYLIQMELYDPDVAKRRAAAENLGNRGELADARLLEKAMAAEVDAGVARLMAVARAKLLVQSADGATRLQAVEAMGDLGSPVVIDLLKRLGSDDPDAAVRAAAAAAVARLQRLAFFYEVLQTVFVGLSLGSVLVLMALGLAVIYGQMGVINMAHGEFMMIGAYTTFVVQSVFAALSPEGMGDVFFVVALPLSFVVAGVAGLLIEFLVIRHLYSRPLESLLATWGISLILVQAARSVFGDLTAVRLPQLLSGGWEIAPQVVLPYNRLFIMALTGCIVGGLYLVFFRTDFGLKIRAVTQNRDMSACVGIPVRRIDSLTFLVGAGIAGVAGWAITLIGNVVPNMGQTYIVDSFLVVVTGGVGKLMGTISAGMGIGIVNKVLEPVFEAVYGKVIILALIIAFLQSRPTGIFPARGRSEEG